MIELCRHILPGGRVCKQAAVKGTLYCRHHQVLNKTIAECEAKPDPYGIHKPLKLVFPENRAALQMNLFMVLQAYNERRIDQKTAQMMNTLLRTMRAVLADGPLMEEAAEDAVQRVILTPEGDEIAPPREQLEQGEAEPLHHKDCPCQRCAEQFRNAAPEQHHQNCQCGFCEPASTGESDLGQGEREKGKGESKKSKAESEMGKAESETTSDASENPEALSPLPFPLSPCSSPLYPAPRLAPAHNLYSKQLTIDPANKEVSLYDYLYGDKHKQYEAQYAARARAAIEAGIEPPPYEPFDPKKIENEGMRRYKATMEEVEKNKQIAEEIWQRRFGNEDQELSQTTEFNAEISNS